ncbi:Six-bladed beta-propeller, TolB-like [Sesbania bispinosa]|nr:Six-bladed beta-propeller, TolB-like [Sesbania bispinosa]
MGLVSKFPSQTRNHFSVQHSRSMMKFESGYTVETLFDGSKLGIEPHSVEVSPDGEFLVLDSENSNIYKISNPMSRYSRPKLLAGSPEGYIGHIDGRPREARMNHPKGLTIDGRGNIYIADTLNMAIRKISDEGVTTIAGGGKWGHAGHVDGPSEDAKFSNDFDVVYVGSSCSLLVVDRGNQAIREIQLHQDDCTTYDEYENSFNLGIVVLVAAGFFGYMLALLQQRVRAMFSSPDDPRAPSRTKGTSFATQQRPPPKSVRPPLIPSENEFEKADEGFFVSLGRLLVNSGSSMGEILGGLFSGSKRKPLPYQQYQYANRHSSTWPMQESFVIPDEDEPPAHKVTMSRTVRQMRLCLEQFKNMMEDVKPW